MLRGETKAECAKSISAEQYGVDCLPRYCSFAGTLNSDKPKTNNRGIASLPSRIVVCVWSKLTA